MPNIVLSGCNGRMGRVITEICAAKPDMHIVAGFDLNTQALSDYPVFAHPADYAGPCDVVIDFSNAALTDMAARRPHTPEEFLEVNGAGKKKAAHAQKPFARGEWGIGRECQPAGQPIARKWRIFNIVCQHYCYRIIGHCQLKRNPNKILTILKRN